jgi:pimeloyl-ACP methyl ester carboxylesterase
MHKQVVLLHGFNKSSKDMRVLGTHLHKQGLRCTSVDLPLTFERIEHCASLFEELFGRIQQELGSREKISLVGHSSGGLVIRKFLSDTRYLDRVHKCVLVATPNDGSRLADYAGSALKAYTKIYKTVQSLQTHSISELRLQQTSVEIGAIAGNRSNLLLGRLLRHENDGRVEVRSVYYEGLQDFIVLPYGHKDIHYQPETASRIASFIQRGTFQT